MSEPTPTPLAVELLGWYGTAAITGAYLSLSAGWLDAGALYQALNLSGALGIVAVCAAKRAWQPMTLNLVWSAVALFALLRMA